MRSTLSLQNSRGLEPRSGCRARFSQSGSEHVTSPAGPEQAWPSEKGSHLWKRVVTRTKQIRNKSARQSFTSSEALRFQRLVTNSLEVT